MAASWDPDSASILFRDPFAPIPIAYLEERLGHEGMSAP